MCRNCGLPIASATDPLRGVSPGRVDIPSAQRSSLSATVGLVFVVGLLLVAGTLAVSGGGILSTGGRLGVDPVADSTATPALAGTASDDGPAVPDGDDAPDVTQPAKLSTSFDFQCEEAGIGAIKDFSRGKWFLSQFLAGSRPDDGYDRITWKLSRKSRTRTKDGTEVTMEWMTPKKVQSAYGIKGIGGDRAIVVTFDGPVEITANQVVDSLLLEREGVTQVRKIQMFEGQDGKVRTVIGLRGDSCAGMSVRGKAWDRKSTTKNASIYLDIERF